MAEAKHFWAQFEHSPNRFFLTFEIWRQKNNRPKEQPFFAFACSVLVALETRLPGAAYAFPRASVENRQPVEDFA